MVDIRLLRNASIAIFKLLVTAIRCIAITDRSIVDFRSKKRSL